jgi:arylsulfatase A-like enzyme
MSEKVWQYLHKYFLHILLSLEMLFFTFLLYQHRIDTPIFLSTPQLIRSVILGLVTLNITIFLLRLLTRKVPVVQRIIGFLLLLAIAFLAFYHDLRATRLDVSMMMDNIDIAFNMDSIAVISRILNWKKVLLLLLFSGVYFGCFEFLYRKGGNKETYTGIFEKKHWRVVVGLAALSFNGLILFSREVVIDEWTALLQQAVHYTVAQIRESRIKPDPIPVETVIRTRGDFVTRVTPYDTPPNVIILMIESFNAAYVETSLPDGTEITPVFNKLTADGFYPSRFYGNSIQTSKGQYAALFSQIPSYKGKVFVTCENHRFYGLADILKERGYRTALVKGYKNVNFDNTRRFLESHGYDTVFSLYDYLSDEETEGIEGWGPEDALLYRHLPEIVSRTKGQKGEPFLLVLHTVMNHAYFDRIPSRAVKIIPEPKTLKDHYTNSIHICDEQLPLFFEELDKLDLLDNSVIIIMGDHSFPTGNHGITYNEIGIYDESFKTPFLLLAPGHLEPFRNDEGSFSQLDMVPTILDLLGIRQVRNTFAGQSMLRTGAGEEPVYLIQPYRGNVLISVRYPYRYFFQESAGREYIFNLSNDPDEKHPLTTSEIPADLLQLFREDVQVIKRRQILLNRDMLFPE